jgi:DNA-binding LacI/PurR family transcriptional regulator
MRVTINDIARVAGFSKTAVSFAFNDPGRISTDTREKILRVAEQLGYVPDPVARNLSLRRVGTIGFLVPQTISEAFANPYISQILLGIGDACQEEEYSLTVVPPIRNNIFDGVRNAAVDGFITMGLQPEMKVVQLIKQRHIPFVTIDGRPSREVPSVNVNDEQAAFHQMKYILDQGHRRLAILCLEIPIGSEQGEFGGVSEWRLSGYRRALKEFGLDVTHEQISLRYCHTTFESGAEQLSSILDESKQHPTAVVAMSDVIAIGAMKLLESLRIRVPDDVSIVGFDDIPEAKMIVPNLTTIHQPGYEKGKKAGEMLFGLLAGKKTEYRIEYNCTLEVRSSVAALP